MNFIQKLQYIFWNDSQRRLHTIWRLALHTVMFFLLSAMITFFLSLLFSLVFSPGDSPWASAFIVPLATLLGTLLATFLCGRFLDKRSFPAFGFHFSKNWWLDLGFGLGLGAVLMLLIFGMGRLTDTIQVTGYFEANLISGTFQAGFLAVLWQYLCVGVYEELISRGYHLINVAEGLGFKWFTKKTALIAAWFLSSAVFGLLHVFNPNASLISTINIMVAGLFLGLGMVLTGELAIPIGLHITWNFFQGVVFGFPVSGTGNPVAVIGTELVGPEWLTGGAFGPEAGLLGLGAMLVGSLITLLWVRRRKKTLTWAVGLAEYIPPATEAEVEPSLAAEDENLNA